MDEETYYEREIRKIELQKAGLLDQYNTLEKKPENQYVGYEVVTSKLEFTPAEKQTWLSYYENVVIYERISRQNSEKTHINGTKGSWWTHRNPMGCFICNTDNLLSVVLGVLKIMANKYPKDTF